ncbi:MAG: hypothetical protein ACJ716_05205 [Marmoricola sp.]
MRWTTMVVVQCERLASEGPKALRVQELKQNGVIARDFEMLYIAQAERQFLLVALRNLMRALDFANYGRLPDGLGDTVTLMRDVLEHWDEYSVEGKRNAGRAGREYRGNYPDSHPLEDMRLVDGEIEAAPGVTLTRLVTLAEELSAYVQYPWTRVYPPVRGPKPKWPLADPEGGN